MKLEIKVGTPVSFKPSKGALIANDLKPGSVNVYFPVSVKNIASRQTPRDTMVLIKVINAEQGEYDGIREIADGEVESFAVEEGVKGLGAGKTFQVKDGWSMDAASGIEYEIAIDGQAGYAVTFHQ